MMWTVDFWRQTAERAIKTAAQAGLAFFIVGQTDLMQFDWKVLISGVGVATIASILTSIASNPFGPVDSPSLVNNG